MPVQEAADRARRRERGDADGQREALDEPLAIAAGQGAREHPPSHRQPGLEIGRRQQEGELVTAHAEGPVAASDRMHRDPAHGGEQVVAGRMASFVVDLLEVVHVDQQQR
jgi:hypothetical protein